MAYIYKRGSKWWCRVKDAGKWISTATPFGIEDPADKRKAKRFADSAQSKLDARRAGGAAVSSEPLTVRRYVASWIQKRREADLDWKNDQGRLKHHVLPIIGDLVLADVRAPHIVDLFHVPAEAVRYREPYATKSTFITVACKDGADPDVIEPRVIHTKKSRSAFDGYRRDGQWPETCGEVAKLRVARRARVTGRVTVLETPAKCLRKIGGGGGSRIPLHLRSMTH